jgi:excinuclease UvrABC nuclease subunit
MRMQPGAINPVAINPHGFNVYILLTGLDVLYVGQSTNILARLGSHLSDPSKRSAVTSVRIISCKTKREMDQLEMSLIGFYQPPLNIRGKEPGGVSLDLG